MLYISYNNNDIITVCQTILSLKEYSTQVWFDRHEIPLFSNRESFLTDIVASAKFALVFISNKYLSSPYCMQELENLEQYSTDMIAVIIDDIELAHINDNNRFLELVDIRNLTAKSALRKIHQQLIAHTGKIYKTTISSERLLYTFNLINGMEINLSQTITGISLSNQFDTGNKDSNTIQPRLQNYISNQVKEGSFSLTIDNEQLVLENLLSLLDIQPYTVLRGVSGSGKSVIGWLIALHKAHQFRLSDDAHLPVYLDCQTWENSQSFSEFFSGCWQLALDWRVWLSKHAVFFIIDIDELTILEHPDYLEQIEHLCLSSELHACLLITSTYDEPVNTEMSVAIVTITPLKNGLIDDFTELHLPEFKAKPLQEWYRTIEADRFERQVDYVSYLIEHLNTQSETEFTYPILHLATKITHQRWKELTHNVDIPISYAEFHASLTYLAWSMLVSKTAYYLRYSQALNCVGDPAIIELGIELDLFEITRDYLRFKSRLIQEQLAAYVLLDDGLYKHLQKPIFDDDGSIIDSKWNPVFLALFEIIDSDQYDELIELIDDVNPFLAIEFARRDKKLLKQYLFQLIGKLLDVLLKNPRSRRSIRQTLIELPYVEDVAICLVQMMTSSNLHMMDILYEYLQSLSLRMPDELIQGVHDLERHFHDSRQALLLMYPSGYPIMFADQLLHHADPAVQRNTISLLGECGNIATLPGLCSCLDSPSDSLYRDALDVITRLIVDDNSFQYFLGKLPIHRIDVDVISTIFAQVERPLSEILVRALSTSAPDFNREFCLQLLEVQEASIAKILTQQLRLDEGVSEYDISNELKSDNAMKLIDLIQEQFRNIEEKAILEQLFADITRILKTKGRPSDTGDSNNTLYNRTQGTVKNKDTVTFPNISSVDEQSIPSELLDKLSSEDWLTRYRALEELGGYPDHQIRTHVIDAAVRDNDVQIRITALGILANLSQTDETQQILIQALADEDSLVIDEVTDYIKDIDDFDVSNIIPLLEHPIPHTIAASTEILTVHYHPDAVDALGKLLDDDRVPWLGEDTIAQYAAKALQSIANPQALELLKQSHIEINRDNNDIIPPEVEHTQQKYTSEQKLRLTLKAMRGDQWDLSQKAARYLRKLAESFRGTQNQAIISGLEDALNDEIWTVRWAVVEALAWVQSPTSIPKLTPLLQDSNWMVQVAVIRGLVELDARETAPDIVELLTNTNTAVAEAAAEALGILKNTSVVDSLAQALQSQDEFVRLATIKSISQILQNRATPYLFSSLNDSYNHIRWFAIKQLSACATPEHLSAIINLLPDQSGPAWEEGTISDYAIVALRHINTAESQRIVDEWVAKQKEV